MIDYWWDFHKTQCLQDPETLKHAYNKVCTDVDNGAACCVDTQSMLITKLNIDNLVEGLVDPESRFECDDVRMIQAKHFVFRIDFGLSKWFLTHSMLIIGDYLIHSYYEIHPLKVVRLTSELIHGLNEREFVRILGFDNHKGDRIYYTVPTDSQ